MKLEELQQLATHLNIDLVNQESGKGASRGSKSNKTVKQLIDEIKAVQDKNKPNVPQQVEPVYVEIGNSRIK